jgi:DNA mismatch repair protein MutL
MWCPINAVRPKWMWSCPTPLDLAGRTPVWYSAGPDQIAGFHTGFIFSKLDKNIVELKGVPISVVESNVSIVLEQLINDVENEVPDNNFSQTDMLAKSLAKSLAIKTGQNLTELEQEHLVNSLFACKEPSISPTNKPTFITMNVEDLDKKFN